MTGYEMIDKALDQLQQRPKVKYTIGIFTKKRYVITCENCQAEYEGNYANSWSDDWNFCPNCGAEISF